MCSGQIHWSDDQTARLSARSAGPFEQVARPNRLSQLSLSCTPVPQPPHPQRMPCRSLAPTLWQMGRVAGGDRRREVRTRDAERAAYSRQTDRGANLLTCLPFLASPSVQQHPRAPTTTVGEREREKKKIKW